MKIYTRGGDAGETGLLGGDRVLKTDPRVAAYGAVDELNAAIGLAVALAGEPTLEGEPALEGEAALVDTRVEEVRKDLFAIGALLAAANPERALRKGTIPRLEPERVDALERWIDELDESLPALDAFVLPGGTPAAAQLHVARTVCRRAERAIVALLEDRPDLAEVIVPYVNRLSDLLFTLARHVNRAGGGTDVEWRPTRRGSAE